jgi:hypothetical protein
MPANEKTPAPGQRGEGQRISGAGGSNRKATASNAGCPTLHVELYRHTARLRGARILPLLDEAGVTVRMYDRAVGCWMIPLHLADDVICVAEYRQRRFVTVAEVDR